MSNDFSSHIRDNPYLGTHSGKQTIVQAPDAFVYINEEHIVPYCLKCDVKVPIKHYISNISVSLASDGSGGGSASFDLVVPRHSKVQFIRDGKNILANMMEIEIWFKGAFTVHGYPRYYRAFWGYINNISESYSDGNHNMSVSCSDMLSFWNIIKFNMHPSLLGDRVDGRNNQQAWATRFSRSNPFQILAALTTVSRIDMIELQSFKNEALVSEDARQAWRESIDQLMKYWSQRMNKIARSIRIYGVKGDSIFNAAKFYSGDRETQAQLALELNHINSQTLFGVDLAVNESHFSPFLTLGQIDNFQSEHRGRLDIMVQVKDHIGWEFYLDTNGEIVFKPPFYNVDARQNFPVSWIRDIDVISWDFTEAEPEATRIDVTGQMNGVFDSGLDVNLQPCGTFQHHSLCRQYGVRQENIQAHWLKTGKACGYYAADKASMYDANRSTGSVTIPGRPELRLGLPVYIESKDCFYYVHSISHSFSFGSSFTTTLGLKAKRNRFSTTDLIFKNGTQAPNGTILNVDENGINRDKYAKNAGIPNVIMRPATIEEFNAKSDLNDPWTIGVPDSDGVPKKIERVGGYYDVSDNKLQLQRGWDQQRQGVKWDVSGGLWVYDIDQSQTVFSVTWKPEDSSKINLHQTVENACIPVSDASGYSLVGVFPYGRGLIIDAQGSIISPTGSIDEDGYPSSSDSNASLKADAAVLLRIMTPDDQTEVTSGNQTRGSIGGSTLSTASVLKVDQTNAGVMFSDMAPDDEQSKFCTCGDNYTIDNVLVLQTLGNTFNDVFDQITSLEQLMNDPYQKNDNEIYAYENEKLSTQTGTTPIKSPSVKLTS